LVPWFLRAEPSSIIEHGAHALVVERSAALVDVAGALEH
jgi:hypothetical protein